MKGRMFIIGFILLMVAPNVHAQRMNRIGYVDMDYILKNMPTYKEAMNQLNQKVLGWKQEIELRKEKIKNLKQDLENERPLLTKDLIQERQDEIDYQQKQLLEYQQKRFGPEGDMMAQQRQIIQPIQDQVFNAIQEIGKKREYDFIFNSAASAQMLYAAPRHDISDQVLAMITRSSKTAERKDEMQDKKDDKAKGEPVYKSVTQARKDKEEKEKREAARKAKTQAQKDRMQALQHERDSIMAARKKQYELQRAKMEKAREQRRDSIQKEHERILKERQQRRDSIMSARQKERGKQQNDSDKH